MPSMGDPSSESGTAPSTREPVILNIEKTHFSENFYSSIGSSDQTPSPFSKLESLGENDIYHWLLAWLAPPSETDGSISRSADMKITMIRPATETHILKYSAQAHYLINETPELYEQVVEPWILSQPASRINWVYNILDKKKEQESIIYETLSPQSGFISPAPQIVPDLKWDQRTLSSLYMVAIVHDRTLRTLRDLTKEQVPLLRAIQGAANQVAASRYGLVAGRGPALRCFLHYQPTY
ncbi:hypothetical protein OC861_004880 [Tilletia horrida]|nr:hypothetical protein OC861_004880 [Tilletia horrida]